MEIKSLLKYYNQMKKMMGSMGGNRRMQQKLIRQFESGDMKLQ